MNSSKQPREMRTGWAQGVAMALGINAVVIGVGWAWFALWRATGLAAVLGDSTGVLGLILGAALAAVGWVSWSARSRSARERAFAPAEELAKRGRETPGTAALDRGTADELLRALLATRAFTVTDLEANRARRVSKRQKWGGALRVLAAVLGATALVGWAAHVASDDDVRDRRGNPVPAGERYIGAGLYAVVGAATLGYACWVVRAYTSPVAVVDGAATLSTEAGRAAPSHFCTIGGIRFGITESLSQGIVTGAPYRAYCSARGQRLLSLEPLRPV